MAVVVGEDLDLDVPGPGERLLEVDALVAERAPGLGSRAGERGAKLRRCRHEPQALAPAARGRLEHHGVADPLRLACELPLVGERLERPRHHGNARRDGLPAGRGLLAHEGDRLAARADEDDPRLLARAREGRVLGEEAVAGVDGVRPARPRGVEHTVDAQVRLARGGRPDGQRLVGEPHVQGRPVLFREDGHRANPHLAAGADHAHRDLAAVGDEDLAERAHAHRGMFPCFLGGFLSRLPRAISSPATIFFRVWRGSITSSTKPRSAAT